MSNGSSVHRPTVKRLAALDSERPREPSAQKLRGSWFRETRGGPASPDKKPRGSWFRETRGGPTARNRGSFAPVAVDVTSKQPSRRSFMRTRSAHWSDAYVAGLAGALVAVLAGAWLAAGPFVFAYQS